MTVVPTVSEYVTTSNNQQLTQTTVVQITLSRTVATVQVVTGTNPPSLNEQNGGGHGFFDNTGAVVGVFVVVGLAAAAILLGFAFYYVKKKKARELTEDLRVAAGGAGAGGAGENRFGEDDDEELYDHGRHDQEVMKEYNPHTYGSNIYAPVHAGAVGVAQDPSHHSRTGSMGSSNGGVPGPMAFGAYGAYQARPSSEAWRASGSSSNYDYGYHPPSSSGHGSGGAGGLAYGLQGTGPTGMNEEMLHNYYSAGPSAYARGGQQESGSGSDESPPRNTASTDLLHRHRQSGALLNMQNDNHSDGSLKDQEEPRKRRERITFELR
ncbi:hypothetical protein BT69DRAFT_502938 [Atractiella rhizophila]|nr:hypothetical protein BT69DRAFT_502938 [Atractiella rhizophila]